MDNKTRRRMKSMNAARRKSGNKKGKLGMNPITAIFIFLVAAIFGYNIGD